MKKNMYAVIGAMMLAGTMALSAGAATEEEVQGTWYLNTMVIEDAEYNVASLGMEMIIELNADGTVAIETSYDDPISASWSLDGDTVSIFDAEDESAPLEGTYADETLVLDDGEGTIMNLGREPAVAETYEVGAVVAEPAIDDFNGTWNAVWLNMWEMEMPVSMAGLELTVTIDGEEAVLSMTDEGETIEKTLSAVLEGDTLTLKNPEDPEDIELYFDTDTMNLRLHDNGVMSYSDKTFSEDEAEETEAAAEDETEGWDMDTTFAVYFEKE